MPTVKTKASKKADTGRPEKYHPEMCATAETLSAQGITEKNIAAMLGITEKTLITYKKKYPVFFQSIKRGRALADDLAERSLFSKVMGYSHPDVHITTYLGKVTKTPIIKHYPPSDACIFFYLHNRMPEKWQSIQKYIFENNDDPAALKKAKAELKKIIGDAGAKSNVKHSRFDKS